jgi:hypothetical protein
MVLPCPRPKNHFEPASAHREHKVTRQAKANWKDFDRKTSGTGRNEIADRREAAASGLPFFSRPVGIENLGHLCRLAN